MKNIGVKNDSLTMPMGAVQYSGYGICALGGFIDQGKPTYYPVIGGEIQYNPADMHGKVHVLISHEMDYGTDAYVEFTKLVAETRNHLSSIVKSVLMETSESPQKLRRYYKIPKPQRFKAYISTLMLAKVAKNIYNGYHSKNFVGYKEKFYVYAFVKEGTKIPAAGVTQEGLEYHISRPTIDKSGITRVRVNRGCWIGLQRSFGFKSKAAIEKLALYRSVFATEGDGTIDITRMLHAILDDISNMVTLETIPEISAYIADKLIELALYNLVIQGISIEENICMQEYSMIMYNVSDVAAQASLKIKTDEWNTSQVILPTGDLPAKENRYILPLWDGSTFITTRVSPDDTVGQTDAPALTLAEVDFENIKIIEDEKKPAAKRAYKLVNYVTINACGDGEIRANYVILDRSSGPMSSLFPENRINQISFKSVYPWVFGKQFPDQSNQTLEERHWAWIYITTMFEKPDVSTSDIREATLVKLKPFTGTRHYLFDPATLLLDAKLTFAGKHQSIILSPTIFSEVNFTHKSKKQD